MNNIDNVLVLNGPILVRVIDNEIELTAYRQEAKMKYHPIDTPPDIKGILVHRKGRNTIEVTSDIYDVMDVSIEGYDFDETTIRQAFKDLLLSSIQFIAKVAKEEDNAILIQNTYQPINKYFLSTIGVLEDAMIIFAEIKQKASEE